MSLLRRATPALAPGASEALLAMTGGTHGYLSAGKTIPH